MDYKAYWNKAFSYPSYMEDMERFKKEGSASSFAQDPAFVEYHKLSYSRMRRINKMGALSTSLQALLPNIQEPLRMLAITESWCGDAAQNLPYFHFMEQASSHLELRLLYREENLELMDKHLTNGGRSIPVVLFLDAEWNVLFQWGPRPQILQNKLMERKQDPNPAVTDAEFKEWLQRWYNEDAGATLCGEIQTALQEKMAWV